MLGDNAPLSLPQRTPDAHFVTTTYRVGELIRYALDLRAERILVGCGDSGTNDGGVGMAEALGARFLRADGSPVSRGGQGLIEIAHIDLSGLDPRLKTVSSIFQSIMRGPCSLDDAIRDARTLTAACAETVMRMLLVGQWLARKRHMMRDRRKTLTAIVA